MPARSLSGLVAAGVAICGCGGEELVRWDAPRTVPMVMSPSLRLSVDSGGDFRFDVTDGPGDVGGGAMCEQTIVATDDGTGRLFAAWWAPRADSSAVLLVARRGRDRTTWETPIVADGRDRARLGCGRPAPSIVADGSRGHVHLAYFMDPPEGAGVWATHSMEHGTYFHGPVPLVYGDRPARTGVAMDGDLVVWAHEDPNSLRPRISLAISRTAGHIIEHRLPAASPPGVGAMHPRVAVAGRRVALAWVAPDGDVGPGTPLQLRLGELVLPPPPTAQQGVQ